VFEATPRFSVFIIITIVHDRGRIYVTRVDSKSNNLFFFQEKRAVGPCVPIATVEKLMFIGDIELSSCYSYVFKLSPYR
jgi:hypothetical protein